jgi:hypothetical protein
MFRAAVAISLCLAGAPACAAQTMSAPLFEGATGEQGARLLAAHNRERVLVGAPPLQWDAELAMHAASYGPVLASLRTLVHSPRAARPGERENLAMARHGTMSPEQLVGLWAREKLILQPGSAGPECPERFGCLRFPAVSRTGRWEDVAHYTQMVWPTSTRVGCAIVAADWDYLIFRYSPPGNIDGKPIFASAPVTAYAATSAGSPETSR